MEVAHSSPSDIKAWAASLKNRLSESTSRKNSQKGGNRSPSSLSDSLKQDLFDALDLLLQQAQNGWPTSDDPTQLKDQSAGLCNQIVDAIDDSLSQWQANISSAFAQATSNEVARQLKQVAQLATELEDQRGRLSEQQAELEKRLADSIRKQSSLARQRKSIAKELQARKTKLDQELLPKPNPGESRSQAPADMPSQDLVAQLTEELRESKAELAEIKTELADQRAGQQASSDLQEQLAFAQLELEEFASIQEQLRIAAEELDLSRLRCEVLEHRSPTETHAEERVEQLLQTVSQLEAELQSAREQPAPVQDHSMPMLHKMLADTEEQLEDLRRQNMDLAAQVAKQQVVDVGNGPHVSFNQESMSWEERKKLIMQQLEAEVEDPSFDSKAHDSKRVEIERIMTTSQREIDHRDREIAELRAIMEHQSNTSQGVAVGAAAIAKMFESDDLILQERQKLKDIQTEWQEKLRQAEIDLSLERARLARERNQLETEIAQLKLRPVEEPEPVETGKRTRKWLEHLGLREEGK